MNDVSNRWSSVLISVDCFKVNMLDKLWHHRRKAYWMDVPEEQEDYYFMRLKEETDELEISLYQLALGTGTVQNVIDECADVANFAMMIADKVRVIDKRPKE